MMVRISIDDIVSNFNKNKNVFIFGSEGLWTEKKYY